MSPSLRLELTRLFFKLGPPGRMTGQRDAADFQTVRTAARIEARTRALSIRMSRLGSCSRRGATTQLMELRVAFLLRFRSLQKGEKPHIDGMYSPTLTAGGLSKKEK